MAFHLKLLEEHAELTLQNALLGWKLEHYEALIAELMSYLCEEDVLGKQYVIIREERLEEKVQALADAIRRRERKVQKVINALEVLSEKELLLVEMRYFKHYSVNRICEVLDITTPTFNRRKNRALRSKLIPLLAPKQYKSDTKMIDK